jgi:hypothetical protein
MLLRKTFSIGEISKMEMDYISKEEIIKSGNIGEYPIYFLRVDEHEALMIIQSLANQLSNRNSNSGRKEFWTKKREYFSIGVEFDE